MAILARAADLQSIRTHHLVDDERGRVQVDQRRGGGAIVGFAKEQTQHELRQALASVALLLRQKHHQKGHGSEVRVPVRFIP